MFFPARRSCTNPARRSCARCVEIRDWPIPRISWSSTTESSSFCKRSRRRRRVSSARRRRALTMDGIRLVHHTPRPLLLGRKKLWQGSWEIAAADGESDAEDGEVVAEARETETELAEIGPAGVEIVAEG